MLKRRLVLGFLLLAAARSAADTPILETLPKYVDALPIPPRIDVKATPGATATIDVRLTPMRARLHRDLPEVDAWGYEGTSPGPTISVERGQKLEVHWINALPATHVFPLPMGADVITPDVRAVTHLHGAAVAEPEPMNRDLNSDGWPDAWIVPGETQRALYGNDQSARTLWYHDHAMGTTGRNVAAGLVGAYEIHDDYERGLGLPAGPFEIPLILQSKQVEADGTLAYTDDIGKEFYGNVTAVNGRIWPYLDVEPRRYRFRIVNASNARSYALKFLDGAAPGPAFQQIGSDGGFLERPAVVGDPANPRAARLVLAPAERADVIVDFTALAGHTLLLHNNSRDVSDGEVQVPEVLQVRVAARASGPDASVVPQAMRPIVRLRPEEARQTRQIVFDQMTMPGGMTMLTLNGRGWRDPVEERPVLGSTEVWELVNPLIATHPFHIHLVEFQVLDRRLFDAAVLLETGKISYLDAPVAPDANERGWKDTVRVLPQMVTRIIMRFAPFPGYYVYHCHILEHEDMEMMRPFQVIDDGGPGSR